MFVPPHSFVIGYSLFEKCMDSILIIDIDRIYRINWIFIIPDFRKKSGISNPLCENRVLPMTNLNYYPQFVIC